MMKRQKLIIGKSKKTSLEKAKGRVILVSAAFFVLYMLVIARVFDLAVLQSSHDYQAANSRAFEKTYRADIVDRNGILLARSIGASSLYADPKLILSPNETAEKLSQIFPDLTKNKLLEKFESNKRFIWIKRNIENSELESVYQIGDPGLAVKEEYKRLYPQKNLTVHLVGSSGSDTQGLTGLEKSYNEILNKSSEPLALTIDTRIQHILKREIQKTMSLHRAVGGGGLIMNVNTGEVTAAVSLPDYSPQDIGTVEKKSGFNRFSLGVYELGSTFKIFSTAALLEKTNTDMGKMYNVRESIKVGRFQIRDFHPKKRDLTVPEVFMHSSNIGSALMAEEVGTDYLKKFYSSLGLLEKPNTELKEIGNPLIPSPWRDVHTLTASYGHGIAVSPLQLVTAAAMIVNGGYKIQPRFVSSDDHSKFNERIISEKTSEKMNKLLRLVVKEGTGSKAEVEGYLVGGKTGTAEKPGINGYQKDKLISSFLGFFPMNDPEYAVFVMIDEPEGIDQTFGYATGGWVGAPTVSRVISSMTTVLGLQPSSENKDFGNSLMQYVKTEEDLKEEQKIAAN
ncbi:MAG: penicillin-binding protein 2 [Pseudomonadota bacterium]